MSRLLKFAENNLYTGCLLSVLTLAAYLNSTSGTFVFDDWFLIPGNFRIHHIENWMHMLNGYRPLRTTLLGVLYHFFQDNPAGYHTVNILLHIMTVLAVLKLLRILTGQPVTALFGALIFSLHPIQTDSVAYISGIRDTLAGFFYMSSFLFFLKYRHGSKWNDLALCLVFNALGFFSKESAATLLFMYFTYDVVQSVSLRGGRSLLSILRDCVTGCFDVLRKYRWFYAGLAAFFVWGVWYYVIFRRSSIYVTTNGISWYAGSPLLNYLSIPTIILYYIKQLVFPMNLLSDYKFYPILATSILDPRAIATLLGLLVLIGSAFRLIVVNKLAAFGIFWFLIALLPGLNILPHHEFMAEHYLYIPMAGFSLLLGLMFNEALNRSRSAARTGAVISLFFILVGSYGVRTVIRNQDWQNDLTLGAAQLKIRPDSVRTMAQMGHLYIRMNLLESAERILKQALELRPGHVGARNNLGVVYSHLGEPERAIREFEIIVNSKGKPEANSFSNLGVAYMMMDEKERGVYYFNKGLEYDPVDRLALVSLAHISIDDKKYPEAEAYLQRTLKVRPDDVEAFGLLARIHQKSLRFDRAAADYQEILNVDPENREASQLKQASIVADRLLNQFNREEREGPLSVQSSLKRAELYRSIGDSGRAVNEIKDALDAHPDDPGLLKRLAEDLYLAGRYDESESAVVKTLSERPDDIETRLIYVKLLALGLDFDRAEAQLRRIEASGEFPPDFADIAKTVREGGRLHQQADALPKGPSGQDRRMLLIGRIHKNLGLTDRAIEEFSTIGEESPLYLEARRELERIYIGKTGIRWKARAIGILKEIIAKNPQDTDAYNQLGFLYLSEIKDYERAARYFSKSLEIDPDQPHAARVKPLLDRIQYFIRSVLRDHEFMIPYMEVIENLVPKVSRAGP